MSYLASQPYLLPNILTLILSRPTPCHAGGLRELGARNIQLGACDVDAAAPLAAELQRKPESDGKERGSGLWCFLRT